MPGIAQKNYTKLLIVLIYLILFFALFLGIISSIRLNDISKNINQLSQDHDIERSIIKEFQFRFNLADSYAVDFIESSKQGDLLLFQQSYADLTTFIDENKETFESPKKRELLDLFILVISDYEKAFNQYEEASRGSSEKNKDDVEFFASQVEIYKNDIYEKINNLSSEVDREIVNHTNESQANINKTRILLTLLIIIMIITGPLSGWVIIRQNNESTRQKRQYRTQKLISTKSWKNKK